MYLLWKQQRIKLSDDNVLNERSVVIISSDIPFLKKKVLLTTVPLNTCSDIEWMRYSYFISLNLKNNFIIFDCGFSAKETCACSSANKEN